MNADPGWEDYQPKAQGQIPEDDHSYRRTWTGRMRWRILWQTTNLIFWWSVSINVNLKKLVSIQNLWNLFLPVGGWVCPQIYFLSLEMELRLQEFLSCSFTYSTKYFRCHLLLKILLILCIVSITFVIWQSLSEERRKMCFEQFSSLEILNIPFNMCHVSIWKSLNWGCRRKD